MNLQSTAVSREARREFLITNPFGVDECFVHSVRRRMQGGSRNLTRKFHHARKPVCRALSGEFTDRFAGFNPLSGPLRWIKKANLPRAFALSRVTDTKSVSHRCRGFRAHQ